MSTVLPFLAAHGRAAGSSACRAVVATVRAYRARQVRASRRIRAPEYGRSRAGHRIDTTLERASSSYPPPRGAVSLSEGTVGLPRRSRGRVQLSTTVIRHSACCFTSAPAGTLRARAAPSPQPRQSARSCARSIGRKYLRARSAPAFRHPSSLSRKDS